MNRRLFAIGTLLLFAVPAFPQPRAADAAPVTDAAGVPTLEAQMKLFTSRLSLTGDQQAELQPILQDLHDATVRLMHNDAVTSQERIAGIHAERLRADQRIRKILNDEQKKQLDQVEQEPHPELHGNIP